MIGSLAPGHHGNMHHTVLFCLSPVSFHGKIYADGFVAVGDLEILFQDSKREVGLENFAKK